MGQGDYEGQGRRIMKWNEIFKNVKLKHQLFLLIGISAALLLLIQIVYLSQFYYMARSTSEVNTSNLLSQFEENMSIHAKTMIELGNTIAYNTYVQQFMGSDNYQLRADYVKFIRNLFDYISLSNSNIQDIILHDSRDRVIFSRSVPDYDLLEVIRGMTREGAPLSKGKGSFQVVYSENTYTYVYTLPFGLFSQPRETQYCYIVFTNDSLNPIMQKVQLPQYSSLYLVNQDNSILAVNGEGAIGDALDPELTALVADRGDTFVDEYRGEKALIKRHLIPDMSWTLISVVPIKGLLLPIKSLRVFTTIFAAAVLILLFAFGVLIIGNITRPINRLSAFMKNINYGSLKKRLVVSGDNEVEQMAEDINEMLEEIERLTTRIFSTQGQLYEMELAKKQAELSALQNQINPHFLYNTLDCIRNIAFSYKSHEIVSISSSMSKMLRYCIRQDKTVTVREELACIDNYIDIIKVRYNGRYTIKKEIDPALLPVPIIKFILQPIIENAVYHGLEMKSGPGTLEIKGSLLDDGRIVFEIRDSGIGIPPEALEAINRRLENPEAEENTVGIGLSNINIRIRSVYGPEYGLNIESRYKEGTCVTLRLAHLPVSL